jgi:hypothetical protein
VVPPIRIRAPGGSSGGAAAGASRGARAYSFAKENFYILQKIVAVVQAARAGYNLDQTLTGEPEDLSRISAELSRAAGGGAGRVHVPSSTSGGQAKANRVVGVNGSYPKGFSRLKFPDIN